jgi:hypothetical protein
LCRTRRSPPSCTTTATSTCTTRTTGETAVFEIILVWCSNLSSFVAVYSF